MEHRRRVKGLATSCVGTAFYNTFRTDRGRIEVKRRQRRRSKQLLVDFKEKSACCK
jgi:hypothetical protein